MDRMSRKEKVGIGEKGKGDKLKGTSRPSDKFPIGEYICRIDILFYKNFLQDFLPDFSTTIFYFRTCAKKVLQKIKTKR